MRLQRKISRHQAQEHVQEAFRRTQLRARVDTPASAETLRKEDKNWRDAAIPDLQRQVVNIQLENLRAGIVDPVFSSFATALRRVRLREFSLLDAACATGYYSEVTSTLDRRRIHYLGSDYSLAMIERARLYYPGLNFEVQDLTDLAHPDKSFDVVMLSAVLEHLPQYESAIVEACRVARSWIIVHRSAMAKGSRHELTMSTGYNIETPRIFYARKPFLQLFTRHGFSLEADVPVYKRHLTWRSQARRMVRRALGSPVSAPQRRTVRTFVFQRRPVVRY